MSVLPACQWQPDNRINSETKLEQIRQIGLIQQDEFEALYMTIITTAGQYALVLGELATDPSYFEILFKTPRKRRSAIFEFGFSEADQGKRTAWTFSLIVSLSIRHTLASLNRYDFIDTNGHSVSPAVIPLSQLENFHYSRQTQRWASSRYIEYLSDRQSVIRVHDTYVGREWQTQTLVVRLCPN